MSVRNALSLICEKWTGGDSNPRHLDFQSSALPTELPVPVMPLGMVSLGAWAEYRRSFGALQRRLEPILLGSLPANGRDDSHGQQDAEQNSGYEKSTQCPQRVGFAQPTDESLALSGVLQKPAVVPQSRCTQQGDRHAHENSIVHDFFVLPLLG